MSWELFTSIVDQFPRIARVVLHGVGEPMMVRDLPRMIRYLKDRGSYVLFNTNGTLLSPKRGNRAHRVPGWTSCGCRWTPPSPRPSPWSAAATCSPRSSATCGASRLCSASGGALKPKVSLWLTGLRETIGQLPAFVRLAQELEIGEVYLQRLVYFDEGQGLARGQSSLFERMQESELAAIREAEALAADLGIAFNASGATEPETSLKKKRRRSALVALPAALDPDVFHRPWPGDPLLRRPLLHAGL